MAIGKYIYGIINSNTNFHLYMPNNNKVYAIFYLDISAVVCDSEIIEYSHMRKDELARLLLEHQRVIDRIMGSGLPVIPMKLGTFAGEEVEVKDFLNKGYRLIKDIMEKINDKIEIDVVATWSDFPSILKEVGEEKEIRELKDRFLSNSKELTVNDQMKIGFMVKKTLDRKRESYSIEMLNILKNFSSDFRGHELMDDKMVLNAAFLINTQEQKDFEKKVEELNVKFNEKLNFRCVGPLPPYSFYTLEIKKMRFEEIDWAREKLRLLNNSATRDEIKKAHQALAFALHPDKNPNTPGIEKEFDDVTRAYNVLWEYCQKDSCSFKEDEFKKNAILVKVRG